MLDVKTLMAKLLARTKDQTKVLDLGTTWVSSTSAAYFSKSYTLPSGYTPLWAWVCTEGDVRASYISTVSNTSVGGWVGGGGACNVHIFLLITKT